MAKTIQEIVALLSTATVQGKTDVVIEKIAHDSRKVEKNTLFVCLVGEKTDGHNYIKQAYERGAKAILVQQDIKDVPADLTVIKVDDTRVSMSIIAPYFFDYPSRKLRMLGVTGTNGKTTTTYLIRSILMQAGFKVGVIGTIQNIIGDKVIPAKNTTPDIIDLQCILAEMVTSNIDYVVMEVSSHALALDRVAGCEFDLGIFTNLTRDHLDFHHTFENYIDAKAQLFRLVSSPANVKSNKNAIVNIDDAASKVILQHTTCKTTTYGINNHADLVAKAADIRANGARIDVVGPCGEFTLNLKITGLFNVYNVLGAIGAALAEGVSLEVIKTALENFQSVSGRFELIDAGQPFTIIVDYAHTPDGLENILKTAKEIAKEKIIVVFGCGGDRDRTKRPIMGKIAAEYGDVVIATSDNPRSEDPAFILDEIEVGIRQGLVGDKVYEKIIDRRTAIKHALTIAEPEDIVIIAGKGHENYQILKDRTISFDDKEVAREIIKEMI